jgi:hypothetical protein
VFAAGASYVAPRRGTESQRARPPRCEALPPKPERRKASRGGFLKRRGTASFFVVREALLRGTMWSMPTLRIAEVLAGSGSDWAAYLDSERVGRYTQDLDAEPPVVVFDTEDGLLLTDGYHRVAAAQRRGAQTIAVEVHRGSREDALCHAAELSAAQRGISLQDALAYIKRRSGRWGEEQ